MYYQTVLFKDPHLRRCRGEIQTAFGEPCIRGRLLLVIRILLYHNSIMISLKQYCPVLLHTTHQYKYLASISLMAACLTYATVYEAQSVNSMIFHRYSSYMFFVYLPLFFSLGLTWKYFSFGTGYKVIGDDSAIKNKEHLHNLLRCFVIHNNRLCHRSRLGMFLSLVILVNAYVLPTLAGFNLNFSRNNGYDNRERELFEDILSMLANTSVLAFTIVQILFGFDIALLALGGRYVINSEEEELERMLKKPVREALLRYPIQVDIVSREGSSYALVRQTTDGISFGGVSISSFQAERPQDQLKKVDTGLWKVVHIEEDVDTMNDTGLTKESDVVI